MGNYDAVLLDFDGTLLNSREVEEKATKRLFEEQLGIDFDDFDFQKYLGLSSKKILEDIAPNQVNELFHLWVEYENEYRWMSKLFPGIREMLQKLRQANVLLAVVTAQSNQELFENRKYQRIDKWIQAWVSSDDVPNPKPAPDQVSMALNLLNVSPEKAIMIGDTQYDILSGKRAGTKTGVALWGVKESKELMKFDPDHLFYDPKEVVNLCLNGTKFE
jgi:pyrophosphatase PpaX